MVVVMVVVCCCRCRCHCRCCFRRGCRLIRAFESVKKELSPVGNSSLCVSLLLERGAFIDCNAEEDVAVAVVDDNDLDEDPL